MNSTVKKSNRRFLLPGILAIAFIIGILGNWYFIGNDSTIDKGMKMIGGEFTLTSEKGPVSLKDFRDKAVLISFGYTSCPDICPTTLAKISSVMDSLGESDAASVQTLFISVDPDRDTPEKTHQYASYFHPSFIGLSGTPEEIALVAQKLKAFYGKIEVESEMGYTVGHTGTTYLLGKDGVVRGFISHDSNADEFVSAIQKVLSQS